MSTEGSALPKTLESVLTVLTRAPSPAPLGEVAFFPAPLVKRILAIKISLFSPELLL